MSAQVALAGRQQQEIERLRAENAQLREQIGKLRDERPRAGKNIPKNRESDKNAR